MRMNSNKTATGPLFTSVGLTLIYVLLGGGGAYPYVVRGFGAPVYLCLGGMAPR
jgi:hypothetical protein